MSQVPSNMVTSYMDHTHESASNTEPVLLYVKAGADGRSYGACPFCQSAVMMLLTKAEMTYVNYSIKTVDLRCPPDEFKHFSNKVPFLNYGPTIFITDMDEIVNFLESIWPDHPIESKNEKALEVIRSLFSKFCFFIKGVTNSPAALVRELTKINTWLRTRETRFLDGDTPKHVDCLVLSKLQHIRVAAKVYRGFEIPEDLTYLWAYMESGYTVKAFRQSCPSDHEIVLFWSEYQSVPRLSASDRRLYSVKSKPSFTLDVPEHLRAKKPEETTPESVEDTTSDDQVHSNSAPSPDEKTAEKRSSSDENSESGIDVSEQISNLKFDDEDDLPPPPPAPSDVALPADDLPTPPPAPSAATPLTDELPTPPPAPSDSKTSSEEFPAPLPIETNEEN